MTQLDCVLCWLYPRVVGVDDVDSAEVRGCGEPHSDRYEPARTPPANNTLFPHGQLSLRKKAVSQAQQACCVEAVMTQGQQGWSRSVRLLLTSTTRLA